MSVPPHYGGSWFHFFLPQQKMASSPSDDLFCVPSPFAMSAPWLVCKRQIWTKYYSDEILKFQAKMETWSQEEVFQWLQTACSLSEHQAQIFITHTINGQVLQSMTEAELQAVPFNLTFGQARTIKMEREKLQAVSG
jgi:hypothetical protein